MRARDSSVAACPASPQNPHKSLNRLPRERTPTRHAHEQIAEGMEFLHALEPPILHRDLKSGNVLMSDDLGSRLAIGDFGVARYQSLDTSKAMTAETGSYRWMAPEVT